MENEDHQACTFAHLHGCLLGDRERVQAAYEALKLLVVHCDVEGRIQQALGPVEACPKADWAAWRGAALCDHLADEDCAMVLSRLRFGEEGAIACCLVCNQCAGCRLVGNLVLCRDAAGQIQGGILIGRLRSPQEEAAERSRQLDHVRFRHILESVPQLIGWTDAAGVLRYLNHGGRAMLGVTAEAALPALSQVLPGFAVTTATSTVAEATLETLTGMKIPVLVQCIPDGSEQGGGMTVIVRDLREIQQRQEQRSEQFLQMAQAQRMASLGVLVAGVAHEINNPNNFIAFNAPILRRVWGDVARVAGEHGVAADTRIGKRDWAWVCETLPKLLDGIEHGSRRIKDIVAQLRDYTRSPQHQHAVCDCNQTIGAAVDLIGHVIRKHTRHMIVDVAEGVPPVRIPRQDLEQVMLNLLVNACQALTDPGQAVAVQVRSAAEGRVTITVQDEGRGIETDILPRLGESFVTTKADGTGLGMAIVRRILSQHNATYAISSTVGVGTVITLSLEAAG